MNRHSSMKRTFTYKLKANYKGMAGLYAVLLAVFLFLTIASARLIANGAIISFGGLGLASVIFCFVTGITVAGEDLSLLIANGVSRKTQFFSQVAAMCVVILSMALIESVFSYFAARTTNYRSMYVQIFEVLPRLISREETVISYTADAAVAGFFWSATLYLLTYGLGIFFAALFKRIPRRLRVWVGVGIALLLMFGVPGLGAMSSSAAELFRKLYGQTPFQRALAQAVLGGAVLVAAYWLFRRVPVANNRGT